MMYFLLLLFAAPSVSQSPDIYGGLGSPTDPIPFMKGVTICRLPNGLTVYLLKNGQPKDRAYVWLVVNAGSILEEDDEQGLAHFVEHMAFMGTKHFPEKSDIFNYFRSKGMDIGREINGHTDRNETFYTLQVPVEIDRNGTKYIPKEVLDIIDDWSSCAITFDPGNIDTEKLVILEEERLMLKNVTGRVLKKIMAATYRESRYARDPIGLPKVIENATKPVLTDFCKKWYRPDNMAVILVGDFDDVALKKKLSTYFHAVPRNTPLQRPDYGLPLPKRGNLSVEIITDPELSRASVYIIYNQSTKDLGNTLGRLRQDLIDMLIYDMINRHFEYETRKPDTPYASVSFYQDKIKASSPSQLLGIVSSVKTNKIEKAIEALLAEKERICRLGWTQSEVDISKQKIVAIFSSLASEKKKNSDEYMSNFFGHFIGKIRSLPDNDWMLEAVNKILPHITIEELNSAVKQIVSDDDTTIIVAASEKDKIPSKEKIKQIVEAAKKKEIGKPREKSLNLSDILLDKAPTPGKILNEIIDDKTKSIIWTLSNGAKVVLQKTDNRTNEITMVALAKGGILDVPEKQIQSVMFASRMLDISGVWKYSYDDLLKKLSGKQVSLSFDVNRFLHYIEGKSVNKDLKTLFELIHLKFTKPRFDSAAIKSFIAKLRTRLKDRDANPRDFFEDDRTKIINGNDPYFKPFEFADISKISKNFAFDFINEKILNPADYTFVFVGSIDINVLREYVETYVASIPAKEAKSTLPQHHINRPGKIKREMYRGKEGCCVQMDWIVDSQYSQKEKAIAMVLENYLGIVLFDHIVTEFSKAYTIEASCGLNILLGELRLNVYFYCDSKDAEKIISTITEDINAISAGNVNEDILNKAKKTCEKRHETAIKDNRKIAYLYASLAVVYNNPLDSLNNWPKLFSSVNSKDLKIMTSKILKGGCSQFILHPEKPKNNNNH
ncbi:MAG: insulinase family protein [Endomicrobium sp.]|nr:insulinase family protein [Endomicrobium sp.]